MVSDQKGPVIKKAGSVHSVPSFASAGQAHTVEIRSVVAYVVQKVARRLGGNRNDGLSAR